MFNFFKKKEIKDPINYFYNGREGYVVDIEKQIQYNYENNIYEYIHPDPSWYEYWCYETNETNALTFDNYHKSKYCCPIGAGVPDHQIVKDYDICEVLNEEFSENIYVKFNKRILEEYIYKNIYDVLDNEELITTIKFTGYKKYRKMACLNCMTCIDEKHKIIDEFKKQIEELLLRLLLRQEIIDKANKICGECCCGNDELIEKLKGIIK